MGFVIRLTDGETVVDFLSSNYRIADGGLEMPPPDSKDVWGGQSIYAYGSQLISSTYSNREVTITFEVRGSSRADLVQHVTLIDKLIEAAKRRSIEEAGDRVEFQYAWDGAESVTYYEVVSGELEWPKDVLSVSQVHRTRTDGEFAISGFTLTLQLYPFGYPISPVTDTPSLITLANTNGTGESVLVNNGNDDSHCNFVEISADDLQGSFPLITKITMQSDSGESEKTSKVYIGVRKGDLGFRHILDDSEASAVLDDASPVEDADYSIGGTYTPITFSGTETVTLATWPLSDEEVEATQGAFRVFGRLKDNSYWSTDANYRLVVSYEGVSLHTTEWRTPLETTITLFDFGTLFLPPWLGSMEGIAGLDIELQALRKTDGSTTINLDYMALLPQDGGYRVLEFRGGGMMQNESLVDDGWSQAVYHLNLAGKKSGLPFGLMPPIKLDPGKSQRMYFLMEGTAGSSELSRRLLVSIGVVPTYMVLA